MKKLVHPHRKENFKMVRLCLLYVHSLNFNLENLLVNKINSYQSQKVPHVFLRAPSYLFHFQIFIADQTRPCCLFLLVKFLMPKRNKSKHERACWCLRCRNIEKQTMIWQTVTFPIKSARWIHFVFLNVSEGINNMWDCKSG